MADQEGLFTGADMAAMGKRVEKRQRRRQRRGPYDQDAFHSQLPVFEVVDTMDVGDPGALNMTVECPRKDCLNVFAVNEEAWRGSSDSIARPCPHCFKANRLPQEV